ncbi:MAG TPA: Hsp20/alpha crystallin family protein [Candidatus Thermoplasmatota archaeon]|nr:Hsp20/alpha crystallin family protein [Candidatus Thermoplasmatota archaeon]
MASEPPTTPKDVADALEALARRIRRADGQPPSRGIEVTLPGADAGDPSLLEVDVFSDDSHVTVTAQTRNADAASVHVSVADGRLFIGLGDGPRACRKDLVLPAPVDEDQAYATFRNGILDVVLPRRDPARRA